MFNTKKIILDTNFLLIPGEYGVDIFSEIERIADFKYKLYVMDNTIKELEKLIDRYGQKKEGMRVKLGYIMLKQKNLKTIKGSKEHVDDSIVEYASNNPDKVIVATQDKDLIKRLKGIRTIRLRQKKYLIMG